jgi:cytochrome c-type biogenesis protein
MESDVGVAAALVAGLVSFLSPCVLPLVPGYLSAISGANVSELDRTDWRRVVVPSVIFIAGFSAVFILLGLSATAIGGALQQNQDTLTKVGGVVIILMGLMFIASPFVARVNREWHVDALLERAGSGGQ